MFNMGATLESKLPGIPGIKTFLSMTITSVCLYTHCAMADSPLPPEVTPSQKMSSVGVIISL